MLSVPTIMICKIALILLTIHATLGGPSKRWYHHGGYYQHQIWLQPEPGKTMIQLCPEETQVCAGISNTMADRIAFVGEFNDGNGDGQVTPWDLIKDTVTNDPNNDGCFSKEEWDARRGTIGFSQAYNDFMLQNLPFAKDPQCSGLAVASFLQFPTMPLDDFNNFQLQLLIAVCESDQTLYTTNCDCVQLPAACRDSRFSGLQACVDYNITTTGRTECIFSPSVTEDVSKSMEPDDYEAFVQTLCSLFRNSYTDNPFLAMKCGFGK